MPIIALTASVMRDDYELQRRENFTGYLRKPVLKRELIEELKKHLPFHEVTSKMLDVQQKSQLPQALQQLLIKDYLQQCYEIKKTNNLNEIAKFASSIQTLAQQHESKILKSFAEKLLSATDIFDIVEIKACLTQFIALCNKPKSH